MKIFITGGAGFIGQHIIDALLKRNHKLICLVHNKEIERDGVESIKGDIRNKDSLKKMEGCDAVIANASIYEIGPTKEIRDIMYDVNVNGTKNTLDTALEYKIPKIVFTSSIAALGNSNKFGLACEDNIDDHCGEFATLYEKTKHDSHMYALKLIKEKNAPITIAMPGLVFGENDHAFAGGVLDDLTSGSLLGLIKSDNKYNFIHVEDVAEGIALCLEKGKNEPYLIVGPENYNLTVAEFTRLSAELGGIKLPKMSLGLGVVGFMEKLYRLKGAITKKHPDITKETVSALNVSYAAKNTKIAKELGFEPKPIEERIKQTVEWYKIKNSYN